MLGELLRTHLPADVCIDHYFRAHRQMGSQDRAFAAEQVYACLRHRRLLEHVVAVAWPAAPATAERLLAVELMRSAGWSARVLGDIGVAEADVLARALRSIDVSALPLAMRCSLPDWLADALSVQWGDAEAERIAVALLAPAPVDLRANTLRTTRERLQEMLQAAGYASEIAPTPRRDCAATNAGHCSTPMPSSKAVSSCRTRAVSSSPTCWIRDRASAWSTSAPAAAGKPCTRAH